MDLALKNKVAIVTGAGQGIGSGVIVALAQEGCHVVISDINLKSCQDVAKKVADIGVQTMVLRCDVSKKSDVGKLITQTKKKFGGLDILVNNAGVFPFISLEKMSEKDWDRVIDINLKGVFHCSQQSLQIMKSGGRIITISSIASHIGFEGLTHYCASKAGINGFTRALALEVASKKITVNAVAPGAIDTPGARQPDQPRTAADKVRKQTITSIPLARMGQPEDIAHAVAFLASDKASYITGQVLTVDGGWILR